MITYDLACENGHRFEGWFASREAFEEQLERSLISCPVCESTRVEKKLSAVAVHTGARKEQRPASKGGGQVTAAGPQAAQMRSLMKEFSEFVETNFEDVGTNFAQEARDIEAGLTPSRSIRGTTTEAEDEALREEGVEFLKIPLPKYDA